MAKSTAINKDEANTAAHSKRSVRRSVFHLCSGSEAAVRSVTGRSCLNSEFQLPFQERADAEDHEDNEWRGGL